MSLRHALLGFLGTAPASGYELAREFGESMGWFWYASHSQIYPELHRLEREGLVASSDARRGARRKRVYRLTESGDAELQAWLEEPVEPAPMRDAERVQLVFLDDAPPGAVRRHLEAHRKHHEDLLAVYSQQLREIRANTFPRLAKRLANRPTGRREMIVGLKVLAVQGNVTRARTEIAWADDALSWLEGVSPQ